MRGTHKGEYLAFEVTGSFETGRLLARSWRSRFQTHCCFVVDFDTGLARLVLGARKHRGACRLRNSCFFGDFVSLIWAPEPSLKDWNRDLVLLQAKQ